MPSSLDSVGTRNIDRQKLNAWFGVRGSCRHEALLSKALSTEEHV